MSLPANNKVIFLFCDNVGIPIIEDLTVYIVPVISSVGKIQGDGRKFLDRFKSYFESQISSQSLNEIRIYRLQQKSATKVDLFHIFLSLIVSSSRRMLPFDVWPSFPVTTWTLLSVDFGKTIVLTTQRSQISICFRTFFVVFNCRSFLTRPAYLAALRRLRFAICNRQFETNKDINIWFLFYFLNHLLLRISAVIGRCGPHYFNDCGWYFNNNNVHLSCAHQRPERSHDTY